MQTGSAVFPASGSDEGEASQFAGDPTNDRHRIGSGVLIAVGLLGLAFILRIDHLLDVSFWFDEACSWRMSQFPIGELNNAIARDGHPPLFFLVLKLWQSLFGCSLLSARSLAVFFGILAVAMTGLFVTRIVKDKTTNDRVSRMLFPVLASLMMALSPLQIELSQQTRPYLLGVCLALLAGWFWLAAMQYPQTGIYWTGFSIFAVALSYTHYYGLWTVLAFFLCGVLEVLIDKFSTSDKRIVRQRMIGLIISFGVWQLCWWPWQETFEVQRARADAQLWMPPLTVNSTLQILWNTVAGGKTSDVWLDLLWLAAALWITVPLLCLWQGRSGRLVAFCVVVPVVGSLSYSILIRNIMGTRYLVFAQVFLLIGIAMLVLNARLRVIRNLGGLAVLCWLGFWSVKYSDQRDWHANHAGIHQTMEYLHSACQADEPILVSTPFLYVSMVQFLKDTKNMYVEYQGDHRNDLLAGPPLQASDYQPVRTMFDSQQSPLPRRVWAIDAEQLFGENRSVSIPSSYRPVKQVRFVESFGIPVVVLTRCYELKTEMLKSNN